MGRESLVVLCPTKDIDIDHCYERGNEVKEYLRKKYGNDQCCSVGTYGTIKIKSGFKDLAKLYSINFGIANRISAILTECETFTDIFKKAAKHNELKIFIKKHSSVFNDLQLMLGALKSESTHASAFIITPDIFNIFEQIPLRIDDNAELVSEWEGYDLDTAGFLKQDILRIKQLTKINHQLNSIKEKIGIDIDIFSVPLNDNKVYDSFEKGFTKDIFQFGANGLSGYIKELKPRNIEDLIAGVSLFRPGAMDVGTHIEYVLRKEGKKKIEYINGWENITNKTLGLLYLQETVMRILQNVGGFDLETTDIARKALGKKIPELLNSFEDKFIKGGIKNNFTEEELKEQWKYIKVTSGYLFNKSHAAAYADLGYRTMWLKVNYPIHFWTTAFTFAKEGDIAGYISEINQTGTIKVTPPDINISGENFTPDFKNNSITWSLSAIKQVGEKAVEQILEKRKEKDKYFSFEEFILHHNFKGSKVTKQIVEHMVLGGVFDSIEDIKTPIDRIRLINQYRALKGVKIKETDNDLFRDSKDNLTDRWWWTLQQKKISGFALFDYVSLLDQAFPNERYLDAVSIQEEENEGQFIKTGGYITEVIVRANKNGEEYAKIELENNYDFFTITIWSNEWKKVSDLLYESEKNLLILTGQIKYDNYAKKNVVTLTEKSEVFLIE